MKTKIDFGMEIDVLSQAELDDSLRRSGDAQARAAVRGIRYRRLPQLTGQASGGALSLGATGGAVEAGPDSGFAWSIRRLVVSGLTAGATPDVVNFYNSGAGSQPLWQLNGNSFGETFGRLELTLLGGETLIVASVGTFAATGTIVVSGELIELPQERLGELA